MSTLQTPRGCDFNGEVDCVCGFMLDEYDDGRYRIECADPDTGLVVKQCPGCGRDLNLYGQR
jgi:hypothetical protein